MRPLVAADSLPSFLTVVEDLLANLDVVLFHVSHHHSLVMGWEPFKIDRSSFVGIGNHLGFNGADIHQSPGTTIELKYTKSI